MYWNTWVQQPDAAGDLNFGTMQNDHFSAYRAHPLEVSVHSGAIQIDPGRGGGAKANLSAQLGNLRGRVPQCPTWVEMSFFATKKGLCKAFRQFRFQRR